MKTTDLEVIGAVTEFIQRVASYGEDYKAVCWYVLVRESAENFMNYRDFEHMWDKATSERDTNGKARS